MSIKVALQTYKMGVLQKGEFVMKRLLILLVFVLALIMAGCEVKKPPVGAIFAAFHFCPVSECDNVKLGTTTKQLPYTGSKIFDRWCVEVQFTRNNKAQKAAVEVVQIDPNDSGGLGWSASDPVFNADCGIYK